MILNLLEKYSHLIKTYEINRFRFFDASHELILTIFLKDQSRLFVRDYLFSDNERKYSYHWQDKKEQCIYRWDNAPHHQATTTFPYHVHVGKAEKVRDGHAMTLEKVLEFVALELGKK